MSNNSAELEEYIAKHKKFFWYPWRTKKEDISPNTVVENILNYGDMEDIIDLFQLMGIKNVAKIFFEDTNQSEGEIDNYSELTLNYFTLLFKRYAC
jgi:hypothetical protein